MIVDVEETVDLHETGNLAETLVGGIWITFRNAIPPLQAKVLDNAFNLIMISDEDSILPDQVADLLINGDIDLAVKKQAAYVLFTVNIMTLLTEMGITLNQDYAGEEQIKELCVLLDFFLSLNEYQDLIGLKPLLECQDIPPVNRLLRAMEMFWGEDFDLSVYECMLEDVSEVTLKSIKDSLFNPEQVEIAPQNIIDRVLANKAFLEGTKAYDHLINNGQVGGSMPSYMRFFKEYLEELIETDTAESLATYAKEVLALYLISEINDNTLKEKATRFLYSTITDIQAISRAEALVNEVQLP